MKTRIKPRAGIYLRISDDREGRGLGVKRQRDDTEALVESEGFELVGVFEDNDTSAFSGKDRPAWADLLGRVRADEIDVIVAWATDRLTRNLRDLADLIDLLQETGATVRTVTSGDIDIATPEGEFYATVVGGIARQESRRKSIRAKRKAEELAQAGKVGGGGTRPFGFENDRVTIREPEAELVREAIERVAAGQSLTSITHDWRERGVTTPTGRTWQPSVLRRMLQSPRIAGLREHRAEVVGDAVWQAIVPRSNWETVRAILNDPSRRARRPPRSYLLTGGLAHCGLCESPLVARPIGDGRRAYVCASGKTNPRYNGCGRIKILAEDFEAFVEDSVIDALDGEALTRAIATNDSDRQVSANAIVAEITSLETQLEKLATDHYAERVIGRAEFLAARSAIEAKLITRRKELVPARRSLPAVVTSGGRVLREWWPTASLLDRRRVIELIVDRVVVNPAVRGRNRFDSNRIDVVWAV